MRIIRIRLRPSTNIFRATVFAYWPAMLLHMTTTPDPISAREAHELKKEFCRSLGFDPNDVMRIEFTARFIKVTDKNRMVHVLATGANEWITHYPAGYGHAQQVQH